MSSPACGDCAFFMADDDVYGVCHRYPPDARECAWPGTKAESFCGEFRHAKTGARWPPERTIMQTFRIGRPADEQTQRQLAAASRHLLSSGPMDDTDHVFGGTDTPRP